MGPEWKRGGDDAEEELNRSGSVTTGHYTHCTEPDNNHLINSCCVWGYVPMEEDPNIC